MINRPFIDTVIKIHFDIAATREHESLQFEDKSKVETEIVEQTTVTSGLIDPDHYEIDDAQFIIEQTGAGPQGSIMLKTNKSAVSGSQIEWLKDVVTKAIKEITDINIIITEHSIQADVITRLNMRE